MVVAASKEMNAYFKQLLDEANRCYDVAREARAKGLDPELDVEIPQADDLASRVEMLLKFDGIAEVIREASKKHPNREVMSIVVAKKVANEYPGPKNEALDKAVRVGLAVLTEGILVAPLDGIAEVKIHGEGNSSYASISFAGPIRSAGGTGQAMSVLIADVVRSDLGIGPYEATPKEIERWKEEIPLYRRLVNLQYLPSEEEIEAIISGCKVCVDGEGTEDEEISGYRDLPRMETNRVRGGACLVVAEGLALKAKKLNKHVKKLKIEGWDFLKVMVKEKKEEGQVKGIQPNEKFIQDMVAGRPVYSHPSTKGGFRLRYGRSRTAGLASISIHPAIMYIVQETLAIGTQIKIERPGKAGISTPCDKLDGPLLLMTNGNLMRVNTAEEAQKIKRSQIEKIVELGEILIPVGEFIENNHPLVPAVFDIGWFTAILDSKDIRVDDIESMGLDESLKLIKKHDIPLHPRHTFMWNNLSIDEINEFRDLLAKKGKLKDDIVHMPDIEEARKPLMELGIPYIIENDELILENAAALYPSLGLKPDTKVIKPLQGDYETALDYVSGLAGFKILDRCGTYIGARMARPEKAAVRKMKPPVHGLFPVGAAGGVQRLFSKAAEGTGKFKIDLEVRKCKDCGETGFLPICHECGAHTWTLNRVEEQTVDAYRILKTSKDKLKLRHMPKVKGVKGMISKNKTPEMPEKAILRAKHEVFVFKDGTSRFDCTDAPLTHFKPKEIGTSVEQLKELGYRTDIEGNPLKNDSQMLELRSQDIVLADNGGDYLLQVSHFIDELLTLFYGMEPFYNAQKRQDLIGAGLLGLSPHTSGGVLCRLIGFTRARVGYAHPFFHAAKRRNCFAPDTRIWVMSDAGWKLVQIKDLVDNRLNSNNAKKDDFGTEYKDEKGLFVPSISRDGEESMKEIIAVSKHPAPNHMIELRTRSGRKITVTPEHKMLKMDLKLEFQPAHSLKIGDMIPSPKKLEISSHEKCIDLAEMLYDIPSLNEDLMIRNISKEWIDKVFKCGRNNYLKNLSNALNINKKTLSNYIQRRSIPLWVLHEILGENVYKTLPEDVEIGVKRDNINVKRYLEITENFCKLLGYYTAEGFSRKTDKEFSQVTICIPDEAPRKLIIDEFKERLGIKAFRENKWKITVSSRIVYHVFNDILMAGSNAKNKQVPEYVISSGDSCLSSFLSGYFSGDGSTSRNRLDIRATTVSERLANEIVEALKIFGINSKIYTETREPGGIVKDFYLNRDKELKSRKFVSYVVKITSNDVSLFKEKIDFDLVRKSDILSDVLEKNTPRTQRLMKDGKNIWLDEIVEKKIIKNSDEHVYSLTVEDNHTLIANDLYTGQCDGDEDCFMLLMDGLLNFSVSYLPEKRGGRMDAPLVLMTKIDPNEIDKEAHAVDVGFNYKLEVYEAGLEYADPKDLESKNLIDTVGSRIGSNLQYENFGFTLDTEDISAGPIVSSYKTLESMGEKTRVQLDLARMISAVDEKDVAERLLNNHLIPDMIGNLRTFSNQKVRCTKCGKKYRRMPLAGACKCGHKLIMTVHAASVKKYLEMSKAIAEDFQVSSYVSQRIDMLEEGMCSMFENDKVKDCKLSDFF